MKKYDNTYCVKSKDCKETNCKRHLNGFNGMYISLSDEFNCEEELGIKKDEME